LIFFEQTLIENFSADFDFFFSNAIVIAIENRSQIDRGPVVSMEIRPGRR